MTSRGSYNFRNDCKEPFIRRQVCVLNTEHTSRGGEEKQKKGKGLREGDRTTKNELREEVNERTG